MMMMRFEEQASHPPGLTANEGVNISQRALPPTLPSTLPPASTQVHRLLLLKVCLDMEKPYWHFASTEVTGTQDFTCCCISPPAQGLHTTSVKGVRKILEALQVKTVHSTLQSVSVTNILILLLRRLLPNVGVTTTDLSHHTILVMLWQYGIAWYGMAYHTTFRTLTIRAMQW